MNNKKGRNSRFIKWVIGITSVAVVLVIAYLILKYCGVIDKLKTVVANSYGADNAESGESEKKLSATPLVVVFAFIAFATIAYLVTSLLILFSNKAIEDNRLYALPIIASPIFLVVINALLNLTDKDYHSVTMTVFTATVSAVIAFAGLKFSFVASMQQKRFQETAFAKPDIFIDYNNGDYKVKVSRKECYLCGIFIGWINKIAFRDTYKPGTLFETVDLIYPNRKILYKASCDGAVDLRLDGITEENIGAIAERAREKKYDVFLIFRDCANYYYLAKLPTADNEYKVIGASEYTLGKILHKYMKKCGKIEAAESSKKEYANADKIDRYCAMDWFVMPYNLYADKSAN